MQNFGVIPLDKDRQAFGRYDSLREAEIFVALQRRTRVLQKSRTARHMSPAMRQERPTPRPIELGQWMGRIENQHNKPSTLIIAAPPPAPSARGKGGKSAIGKAFRAAGSLFGDEDFAPPSRGDYSAEHLKDSNALYWAGYDL